MTDYSPGEFGHQLRDYRLRLGWSARQLSELYAEFVGREDSPPSTAFIYQVEKGTTMLDLQRRTILASLVGMPLAFAGIPLQNASTYIDIPEYTQALELYCGKWREGTIRQDATTIQQRTNRLEVASFRAIGKDKRTLLELSVCYQILHADVWSGQNPAKAYRILSSAVETARLEKIPALHAHALTQRAGLVLGNFETTKKRASIQTAIDDYTHAAQEENNLSPFYAGLLQVRRGLLEAYIAHDKEEFTNALHLMTQGSNQIGSSTDDVRVVARLDYERYMLNRALAYIYSPMGNARLGLAELMELERACSDPAGKNRVALRNRLFAEAYLAIGNYPMAVAHLEAALEHACETEMDRLVEIHARLKKTAYWNDPDIGRIAVKINQLQYPNFFK